MQKRRMQPRIPLIHHFHVNNLQTGKHVGHLGNLTTRGIMLFAEEQVEPGNGRVFPLSLIVPRMHWEQSIFLASQCVWCQKDTRTGLYAVGFEIDGVGTQTLLQIHNLICEFGSGN